MFLSSVRLAVENPGFTLGYEADAELPCWATICLVLLDLLLFLLHPIILRFQISSMTIQNVAIKKSRDKKQSPKGPFRYYEIKIFAFFYPTL